MGFSRRGRSSFQSAQGGVSGFNPAQGKHISPLLTGLRNWWKFDDVGSYPDSVTGTDFWTEVNSPTSGPGKIDLGIPFPYTGTTGGGGLVYTGNDLDVGDGTAGGDLSLTVTAWVYQDVGQGAQGKSFLDFQYGFYFNTGHPGYVYTLRANFYLQTGGGADSTLATPTVQTEEWNFVFLRYYNLTDTPTAGSNSYHCGIVTDAGLFTSTPVENVGGYKGTTATCKVNVPLYDLQGTLDLVGMWTGPPLSDDALISLYSTTNSGTDYPFFT
jgi:hypothetical protein